MVHIADHAGYWTSADLERAQESANTVARPRGPQGPFVHAGLPSAAAVEPGRPRRLHAAASHVEAQNASTTASPRMRCWTITTKRRLLVES